MTIAFAALAAVVFFGSYGSYFLSDDARYKNAREVSCNQMQAADISRGFGWNAKKQEECYREFDRLAAVCKQQGRQADCY
jgi:hypothetical protein